MGVGPSHKILVFGARPAASIDQFVDAGLGMAYIGQLCVTDGVRAKSWLCSNAATWLLTILAHPNGQTAGNRFSFTHDECHSICTL